MNPFSRKPDVFVEAEKQVRSELKELSRIANEIVSDQRYSRFRKLLEEGEKNTINLILAYKETDAVKYKAKLDELLIELRVYRTMLNSIDDLVKEIDIDKPSFTQNFKNRMGEILNKL